MNSKCTLLIYHYEFSIDNVLNKVVSESEVRRVANAIDNCRVQNCTLNQPSSVHNVFVDGKSCLLSFILTIIAFFSHSQPARDTFSLNSLIFIPLQPFLPLFLSLHLFLFLVPLVLSILSNFMNHLLKHQLCHLSLLVKDQEESHHCFL